MFNLDCNFFTGLVIQIFRSSTSSTTRQTIQDISCSPALEISVINCIESSNNSQVTFLSKLNFLTSWKQKKKSICHMAEESLEVNTQVCFFFSLKDPKSWPNLYLWLVLWYPLFCLRAAALAQLATSAE